MVTTDADEIHHVMPPNGDQTRTARRIRDWIRGSSHRRLRGRLAIGGAAVLYVIAAISLVNSIFNSGAPATPNPPPAPVSLLATVPTRPIQVEQVWGKSAALRSPQEALPTAGTIAVIDTANKRIAFLNHHGALVATSNAAGSLQQPYAAAAWHGVMYVLDAQLGTIERFDLHGHFLGQLIHATPLNNARGLTFGPGGLMYVASPGFNSLVVVSTAGTIQHLLDVARGGRPETFNQPSDVASGPNGMLYVLDNNNQRVCEITTSGTLVAQWAAPASSTEFSSHVLPLPDGRLLLSDPSQGSLLIYNRGAKKPTRLILEMKGSAQPHLIPLGLARTQNGEILVTDNANGEILAVRLPRA